MSKRTSFINLANELLVFTNLWIYLYTIILNFLNKAYPADLPQDFIRLEIAPEPFEIPLYLLLTVALLVVVWLYYRYFKPGFLSSISLPLWLRIGFLPILLFAFLKSLGNYPMAHDLYPYPSGEPKSTYLLVFFSYLVFAAFIIIQSVILERQIFRKKIAIIFFSLFLFLLLALLTFEPRLPILALDYSYFFGPIWEIAQGKTIYTQVSSQYGFMAILFFSLLYKLGLFNLWQLPAVIWILYVVEYYLCFYLIYKVGKSLPLAVIGLFSILTTNYFSSYILPASLPQIGPIRLLPIIVSLFLLYKLKRLDSNFFIFCLALLSLWVVDSGLYLVLAYLLTLFILTLLNPPFWKNSLLQVAKLIFSLATIFAGVNLIHLLSGYQPIDLKLIF